ncbi:MAG: ferritin-like domain-containing protein, partial [Acidimicrobiales bacterium]
FPGLVVEFADPLVAQPSMGGVVTQVDLDDPVLAEAAATHPALAGALAAFAAEVAADARAWWIVRITQGGVVIDPLAIRGLFLDSLGTWRIVRSLEPGPVQLVLNRFGDDGVLAGEVVLDGPRRAYLAEGDAIDAGYAPGELTQSLCSPWQHDFRDCGCYYWASNHPDIAIEPLQPGEEPAVPPPPGAGWVNWLRAQPPRDNVPEFGYYEISERYQDLAVVLGDRESADPYRPPQAEHGMPYSTAEELVAELRDGLAPLEHALTLEYLYAWSSVRSPQEVAALTDDELAESLPLRFRADPARPLEGISDRAAAVAYLRNRLRRDVTFAREQLRSTAISEMRHLSWVNLLLRKLADMGFGAPYRPALGLATDIPTGTPGTNRPAALRPLVHDTVADFEGVERPSGGLEGRYARVRATLDSPEYPGELHDIASRIVDDGVDHYGAFRRMVMIVDLYDQPAPPHLRPGFALASEDDDSVGPAKLAQGRIMSLLSQGYAGVGDQAKIVEARRVMLADLEGVIDSLARTGVGVPLF